MRTKNSEGEPKPALAGKRIETDSEEQLQSKLNLPGRSEVPCWESRSLDDSKRTAIRGDEGRIAKIWMIEYVKHLCAELKIESLSDLSVFGDGEISIQEAWTNNCITTQAAWVTSASDHWVHFTTRRGRHIAKRARYCERGVWSRSAVWNRGGPALQRSVKVLAQHRIGEVLARISSPGHLPKQVRSDRQRDARSRTDGQIGIDRIAALHLVDDTKLPPTYKAVGLERQLVESAQNKAVTCVKLRKTVIAADCRRSG